MLRRSVWCMFRKTICSRQMHTKAISYPATNVSNKELDDLMAIFPDVVNELTCSESFTKIPETKKHYEELLNYNVPYGKRVRSLGLVASYKLIEKPENLTEENLRKAIVLGWCIEMLQGSFTIADDIIDNSETRRGNVCWYRKSGIGLKAIPDIYLLENGVYATLERHFSRHPCYIPMVEHFQDVTFKTALGEALDVTPTKNGRVNLDLLTMQRFKAIAKYKTGYYTFPLPVNLALYLADRPEPHLHRKVERVLLEMGDFYQVQNDFLDCFGDPSVTGKVGTDIEEGKCTWLVVKALERAGPAQRKALGENYGRNERGAVRAVKDLYEELELPRVYAEHEEESYRLICGQIEETADELPGEVFFYFLKLLYTRR